MTHRDNMSERHAALVTDGAPDRDRFRHVTFTGERPALEPLAPVNQASRAPQPDPGIVLDAETAAFFDHLYTAWELSAARYRSSILWRRRAACLRALRAADPRDGIQVISRDQTASERALGAVLIGVTAFFRDEGVFEALRGLLPSVPMTGPSIEALSVGCSDGSELYSLAMLLAEQGMLDHARLWGIDCRPAAIAAARAGMYPVAATDLVPPRFAHYLLPTSRSEVSAGRVQIDAAIRDNCRWAVADAFAEHWSPPLPDRYGVILCRNLAIYLTSDAAIELWERVLALLAPGGLLIVGKAERPPPDIRERLTRVGPCIYQKVPRVKT
jgi:chemotaxis protein methyltransferase CheR